MGIICEDFQDEGKVEKKLKRSRMTGKMIGAVNHKTPIYTSGPKELDELE